MPLIDANGAKFNYQLDGPANAPVVVFSNSLGTTLSMWDLQIPALSQKFRVLRYDMRGHGLTPSRPGRTQSVDWRKMLLGLLDSLKVEQAHFCGISVGGAIGQWLGVNALESFQGSEC